MSRHVRTEKEESASKEKTRDVCLLERPLEHSLIPLWAVLTELEKATNVGARRDKTDTALASSSSHMILRYILVVL